MPDPAGIADIHALADALPGGFRNRGGGETMQADMYLSFQAGDDEWEIEWTCLDGARNFTMSGSNLSDLLVAACEKAGINR